MGYTSSATGTITITPPLRWGDIKDSPYLPGRVNHDDNWRDVAYVVAETTVDTDHGRLTTEVATGIGPVDPDESMKRYAFVAQLQELVSAHPDRTFTGAVEFLGEDGERWRHVVRGGQVVEQKPRLVWPDDDAGAQCLIWSNQHGAWWRPCRRGYTGVIEEAGRYNADEARRIVADATLHGKLVHQRTDPVTGVGYDSVDEVAVAAPEAVAS